jgi:hypothetical protein
MILQLWVLLRLGSTVTLKTTATTLVSVNGDNGKRGALVTVHLPDASPETITEETPSATVTGTPAQSRSTTSPPVPVVARLDLGRDRVQGQVLAQE